MIKIRAEEIKMVPISEIKLDPKNRNKHPKEQIERLADIITYQGFRDPITVSNLTGYCKSGEGRVLAARKLKIKELPVIYQDYDDETMETADGIARNSISSWAELDLQGINTDIPDMGPDFNIDLLGIKNFTIDVAEQFQCDEDEVPEHVEPITKLGDLYQLGNHRLLCGDSTSIDAVEKLMNGEKCEITFTSPPYNVGRTPNGNDQKYLNDSDNKESVEYTQFLKDFTTNCLMHSEFVFSNIQSLSGNKIALIDYLYRMKENYADTIIWDKETAEPAMAKNCMNSQFEYIHVFSQKANRIIGTKEFRGTVSNLYRHNSRKDKDFASIHKATYPVSFVEYFISTFSNESVLDPFGGSGSTLIACEKTGRKCYMMELDPHYIDVIVARWEKFTGKKAELINGEG